MAVEASPVMFQRQKHTQVDLPDPATHPGELQGVCARVSVVPFLPPRCSAPCGSCICELPPGTWLGRPWRAFPCWLLSTPPSWPDGSSSYWSPPGTHTRGTLMDRTATHFLSPKELNSTTQ